jgi:hypothetical protein
MILTGASRGMAVPPMAIGDTLATIAPDADGRLSSSLRDPKDARLTPLNAAAGEDDAPPPTRFTVLVPVGPSPRDRERLSEVLTSLMAFEDPTGVDVIVVDDAPKPRQFALAEFGFANATVLRTDLWSRAVPDAYSAMVAGTVEGLRATSASSAFVLKLDTDALVVGPFSRRLTEVFKQHPEIGVAGSYDRTCTGGLRDWTGWDSLIARAPRRLRAVRGASGRPTVWHKNRVDSATSRRVLRAARDHGYVTGAHCLGGAYAVSPRLVSRRDLLSWSPWVKTQLGEDVVMGILCFAAGLRPLSLVDRGEPFGLAHVGLPADPEWLLGNGHSIVHSLKTEDPVDEAELRRRLLRAPTP